jgi:hypothetical protein
MKNSSDNIGNGTRDLRACRAVPKPTPPRGDPDICVINVSYSFVDSQRKNIFILIIKANKMHYSSILFWY